METEAPCSTWRRTSGAAPDAVKAARPVLNGGREETCRKVTRLAPTQRRGRGDPTRHICINCPTSRFLRKGLRFQKSARRALCARLLAFWRIVENKSHWVRDVTFDEDRSQVRCGNIPHMMAALRNTAIGLLRWAGHTNIAAACRRLAAQPVLALALIGIEFEN